MITLLNKYYRIEDIDSQCEETVPRQYTFTIALIPDYIAYEGHFPGNPVAPGVCNIQMIKECVELLIAARFFLAEITQCRFMAVVIPEISSSLRLHIQLSGAEAKGRYKTVAFLYDDRVTYMEFKGELAYKGELTTARKLTTAI